MKNHFKLLVAVLCGLCAAAGCADNNTTAPKEIPYTAPDGEIRLISFNIRRSGLDDKDGDDRWRNRQDAVVEMFVRESPSVVGIQEGMPDQIRFLEESLPQFARIGVGRDDGRNEGECMAIFYRRDIFDVPESGTFWLSETPDEVSRGWDAACNRTVTWALLTEKSTGKSFYYLNTHFDHIGVEARRMASILVADYIAESIPEGATVILGGDLNSGIDDPIFDPLKKSMQVARDIAEPTDRLGTFNGFGATPNNIVLDHIFCRGICTAQSPELRVLRGDFGAPFISDHYPVEFVFRLP